MMSYLVVFIGAGVGGAVRHGMNILIGRLLGTSFPSYTLIIHIVGSLVMGLVAGWFTMRRVATGPMRLFLTTGVHPQQLAETLPGPSESGSRNLGISSASRRVV